MKRIYVIGAGQIGSRHLQALRAIRQPLDITVVDPAPGALRRAEERFSAGRGKTKHRVRYVTALPREQAAIDVAIIATDADVRRQVATELLDTANVRYLVLEKLLFQTKRDFGAIESLLKRRRTKAWVNCPMRLMPPYRDVKTKLTTTALSYHATGSQIALVTTAIHYLDHIAYLTGCADYRVDTSFLNAKPVPSKRKGFLELTGTLLFQFSNGTIGKITSYPTGNAPTVVEIATPDLYYLVREADQKTWIAEPKHNWRWLERSAPIPFQSQITTGIVESLLAKGTCLLPTYRESAALHLPLLESVRKFLNKHGRKKYTYYPFT